MSLPACPAPGKCLDLDPRVEALEHNYRAIHADCGLIKQDIRSLMDDKTNRKDGFGRLWTLGAALLFGIVSQIGLTVYWTGRVDEKLTTITALLADHEMRIRAEEREQ